MSPRSSVTVRHSSGVGQVSGGSGWMAGSGSAAERARRVAARGRGRWRARRACGCRRGGSRSSSAIGRIELGAGVADDPGAMAVVGRRRRARSRRAERRDGARPGRPRPASGGPGERLLDVRLGVADELAEERRGHAPATSGSRPPARGHVGQRRDRRADEPALPARRRVDELLELGPAVRLGGDALARTGGRACRR